MVNGVVLFDLDGTLIDSEPIAVEAFHAAFAECVASGSAPVDELLALGGLPFADVVQILALPPSMIDSFHRHSSDRAHRVRLFVGMDALLTTLVDHGVGIGIITGKDRRRAEQAIRLTGLNRFCTELVTPCDPPPPKPAPDGVHWLLDRLSGAAREAVLVGDSVNDIRAGQAAGVRTIACTWGAGRIDALRRARPDALVHSVAHLREVLTDRLLTEST